MEDMNLLRNISFLKDLSTGELIRFNVITETVPYKEDDIIMREGEPCDAVYVIKSGAVKVLKTGAHIETLGQGEPIGEIAFFDNGTRSATLVAGRDAVLIKMPSESFDRLLHTDRELAHKVYRSVILVLCKRLREANAAMQIVPDFVKNAYRGFDDI